MTDKPLLLTLKDGASIIGTAKFTLEGLCHDLTSVSLVSDVEWSPEFIEKNQPEPVAPQEGAAEGEAGDDEAASAPPPPPPGRLAITVSVEKPLGFLLAPLDYD